MGRVGTARLETLMENVNSTVDMNNSSLSISAATISSGTLSLSNGASVTQLVGKGTAVTIDKPTGLIELHAAVLGAGAVVHFTVNNTFVEATDVVVINHHSVGSLGAYVVQANTHAAGSFKITVTNLTSGGLAEALKLHFVVIKGSHT